MWAVDAPADSATDAARACAQSIRDPDLKSRVTAAVADFATNSVNLQANIHQQLLHLTPSVGYAVTNLSAEELRWLYEAQLARMGSKARALYERLRGNARYELCSYCQYGIANTIDHFVPIALVEALAIDPWNLIPACSRCNQMLGDKFSSNPNEQMLHPYSVPASVPPTARWLRAAVSPGPTPVVTFHADPDKSIEGAVRSRVLHQFELLQLGDLYRRVSSRELAGARRTLTNNFPNGPAALVSAHLREVSDDAFAGDPNDRRGAMYEALAEDDWFINGGYKTAA